MGWFGGRSAFALCLFIVVALSAGVGASAEEVSYQSIVDDAPPISSVEMAGAELPIGGMVALSSEYSAIVDRGLFDFYNGVLYPFAHLQLVSEDGFWLANSALELKIRLLTAFCTKKMKKLEAVSTSRYGAHQPVRTIVSIYAEPRIPDRTQKRRFFRAIFERVDGGCQLFPEQTFDAPMFQSDRTGEWSALFPTGESLNVIGLAETLAGGEGRPLLVLRVEKPDDGVDHEALAFQLCEAHRLKNLHVGLPRDFAVSYETRLGLGIFAVSSVERVIFDRSNGACEPIPIRERD